MKYAIMPLDTRLLESMFMLPPGYKIEDVRSSDYSDVVNITVKSDELPDVAVPALTTIELYYTVEPHPDNPDFRRVTVMPRIQKVLEKHKSDIAEQKESKL